MVVGVVGLQVSDSDHQHPSVDLRHRWCVPPGLQTGKQGSKTGNLEWTVSLEDVGFYVVYLQHLYVIAHLSLN